jgi:hypothetical protein
MVGDFMAEKHHAYDTDTACTSPNSTHRRAVIIPVQWTCLGGDILINVHSTMRTCCNVYI